MRYLSNATSQAPSWHDLPPAGSGAVLYATGLMDKSGSGQQHRAGHPLADTTGDCRTFHRSRQAPFWTALGQLAHADLCLARRADGDLDRARDLTQAAAATAGEYGCAGLTKRAAALLADL